MKKAISFMEGNGKKDLYGVCAPMEFTTDNFSCQLK